MCTRPGPCSPPLVSGSGILISLPSCSASQQSRQHPWSTLLWPVFLPSLPRHTLSGIYCTVFSILTQQEASVERNVELIKKKKKSKETWSLQMYSHRNHSSIPQQLHKLISNPHCLSSAPGLHSCLSTKGKPVMEALSHVISTYLPHNASNNHLLTAFVERALSFSWTPLKRGKSRQWLPHTVAPLLSEPTAFLPSSHTTSLSFFPLFVPALCPLFLPILSFIQRAFSFGILILPW